MKRIINYLGWFICIAFIFILSIPVQATETEKYGKGLIFDDDDFLESLPGIIDVKLNDRAIENIEKFGNKQIKKNALEIQSAEMGEEIITDQDVKTRSKRAASQIDTENETVSKITSYDGSLSEHFPPIGNQGRSGSCVSWAYGYYQLTNNIANVRGLDSKSNIKYRISPAWIHNLIKMNDHEDRGADCRMFFALVLKQGAPYWNDFSGQTTSTNFKSWNPDTDVWEKALENRVDALERCSVYNAATKQLDLLSVKKILLNGYVVSFGASFDSSLIYSNRIKYPENRKSEYILTANKLTARAGGHAMTIVGWDDTLRIDIDGDGTADTEGAFKIANSWGLTGTNTNNGYFWLAYDAILPESVVPGINDASRTSAIRNQAVYFLQPKLSYKPLMLLELTLKTESRKQLGISVGASGKDETKPKEYKFIFDKPDNGADKIYDEWAIFRFKNYTNTDTHYDFYGNETNKQEAKFIFDLTDTVVGFYGTSDQFLQNRETGFYVRIEDKEKDGYASVLKGIRIIDRVNNTQVNLSNLGIQVDGDEEEVKLNATVVPGIVSANKKFTLAFNYPIQKTTIDANIKVKRNGQVFPDAAIGHDTARKKIYVSPPAEGYPKGQYYSFDLNGVKSDGGNALSKKTAIDFYVP